MAILKTQIRLRSDTDDNWVNYENQVLADGEAAVEFDRRAETVRMKIGFDNKPYSDLNYIGHEWDIYINNNTLHIDKV